MLKEALPLDAMRMTPKWDEEAQKPRLFHLSDDQKKDTTYRTLFLPNDSMFKTMDSMCLRFVLMAEGMELNKVDVHKSYNVLHVTSPHRLGGMGLHQLFWAHRARFTTMVQNTLRSRPGSIGCDLSKDLPSRAVPIRNYLAILTQLGPRTVLHIALPPRPAGGPNLIDSESSDDGVLL